MTIDDIATLSFSGMIQSNLDAVNSSLYYKNLTWIPTVAQLGYQVMCAMAFDRYKHFLDDLTRKSHYSSKCSSQNAQSSQYCFTFYVSVVPICSCPGEPCITTTTTFVKQSVFL